MQMDPSPINGVFTLTDPIPILIWVPWECTVILLESDTLSESKSSVKAVSDKFAEIGLVETSPSLSMQ